MVWDPTGERPSLSHLSELAASPPRLIELAARAGFSSVGLRISPASAGGLAYPTSTTREQAEVRRQLDATGITVLSIELLSIDEALRVGECSPLLGVGAAVGARRLTVTGDSTDFGLVAEKLAQLADLAGSYGIAVDLEFMPFRAVASLADALSVIDLAGCSNAHVLIDALHLQRSNSPLGLVRAAARRIGVCHLCDAPAASPPLAELAVEARSRRLLPGTGELALWDLLEALPVGTPVAVEVPLSERYPHLEAEARLALLAEGTRSFLAAGRPG